MNQNDNTFIDAYGIDLSNDPQGTYSDPSSQAVSQAPAQEEAVPRDRTIRFDAARTRTLRGPHFDMRRVSSSKNESVESSDPLDSTVIDVGAAWDQSPIAAQSSLEDPRASLEEPTDFSQEELIEQPAQVEPVAETEEDSETIDEVIGTTEPMEVASADLSETPETQPTGDSPARFAPVWEVDRFNWPEEIEQLFQAQAEYFDYAGKKLIAASHEGLKTLAITTTRSGEGSTTLALCLARAVAGAGAKVALLDGNLLRSELGEKLGVDFASGWQSAATGEQPLAEAAITGLDEGITLFPSSAEPVADLDSLGDARVREILQTAADSCDLLIIDAGQADFGDNIDALDAAMVVRDIRHTSEEETLLVATALRDCGVKAVGIAENFDCTQSDRMAA